MDIFLVRHGQMQFDNKVKVDLDLINSYATGVKEGPLSERGVLEAKLVADYLRERGVTALYSSAFARTRQTAEETSKLLGIPVEIVKDFGELNVGSLDPDGNPMQALVLGGLWKLYGVLPSIIGVKNATSILGYFLIVFHFRTWYAGKTVAGESRDEALKRIEGVFNTLVEHHGPSDTVAVFTHGYFIHLLVNHVLDPMRAPWRMLRTPYIMNGSITHVTGSLQGTWRVESYAQSSHLWQIYAPRRRRAGRA